MFQIDIQKNSKISKYEVMPFFTVFAKILGGPIWTPLPTAW